MTQINPDDVLESAKGKCEHVLVVGLTAQNQIHMEMSRPTFEFANFILNRGLWEVNKMNSEQVSFALQQAAEAEANVRAMVEVPKKRGRKPKAA